MAKLLERGLYHVKCPLYWRVGRNSAVMLEDSESQVTRAYEIRYLFFMVLSPWNFATYGIVQPRLLTQKRLDQ